MINLQIHLENAKENHNEILLMSPGERLKLKYLKTTGISIDKRKPELSHSAGEKVTSFHHFGTEENDHNILFDPWGSMAEGVREVVTVSQASGVSLS